MRRAVARREGSSDRVLSSAKDPLGAMRVLESLEHGRN